MASRWRTLLTTLGPKAVAGTRPDEPRPAPDFEGVLAHDGNVRTRADLVGRPTVLWFYPMAATPG